MRPELWTKSGDWTGSDFTLALVLILSIVFFLFNARSDQGYGDFEPVYGSIECALAHLNPYSIQDVQEELISHGAEASHFTSTYWLEHSLLYPPLTYFLLSPLGLLSYRAAGLAYFWISASMLVSGCLLIIRSSARDGRAVVVLGVSAVLATSSVLLRLGQLTTLTIALLTIGAALFVARKHPVYAAVFFFLSAAIKPQMVIPLLLYFCVVRCTRKHALAALTSFILASAAAGVYLARQPQSAHWIADLSGEVHAVVRSGPGSRIDTGLIDLQSLTSLMSSSPFVYGLIDMLIFAAIAAWLLFGFSRGKDSRERDWFSIAALSFFTLLLTYHRTYDMRIQILSFPALGILWRRSTRSACVLTVLAALSLFSTAIVLERIATARIGEAVTHHLLFRLFVERQQALVVLAATCTWTAVCVVLSKNARTEIESD